MVRARIVIKAAIVFKNSKLSQSFVRGVGRLRSSILGSSHGIATRLWHSTSTKVVMHDSAAVDRERLDPPPGLLDRLRQLVGYTWDDSINPIHTSYDIWYVATQSWSIWRQILTAK